MHLVVYCARPQKGLDSSLSKLARTNRQTGKGTQITFDQSRLRRVECSKAVLELNLQEGLGLVRSHDVANLSTAQSYASWTNTKISKTGWKWTLITNNNVVEPRYNEELGKCARYNGSSVCRGSFPYVLQLLGWGISFAIPGSSLHILSGSYCAKNHTKPKQELNQHRWS